MAYSLCFFPLVGLVIGVIFSGIAYLARLWQLGPYLKTAVLLVCPILLTGGIHIDGYMDTSDAMASYQTKERRLEILKDSHIGAFAVIRVICYFALYAALLISIEEKGAFDLIALCFMMERAMSAMAAVTIPNARKNGMLDTFTKASKTKAVIVCSVFYLIAGLACAYYLISWKTFVLAALLIVLYGYYRSFAGRNFGGVTGDLAGYYLQIQELCCILATYVLFRI